MTFDKDQHSPSPTILTSEEGRFFGGGAVSVCFKVTSAMSAQQVGIYKIALAAGTQGAEPHYHKHMGESFYVLEGSLTVLLGEEEHEVGAGGTVFVPPGTVHAFRNAGEDKLEILLVFTPCEGREGYFEGLFELLETQPDDMKARLGALALEHDSYFVGQ